MKLTKFLLPITLLFGVVFFTPTDTYRTYAEESTSEVTSEVTEENQFEKITYTYTCDEGSVIFTLISETEVYGKITTAKGEIFEGTASYSIQDNLITITKTGEEPLTFKINGTILTVFEDEPILEENYTFLDWIIANEDIITLIMTAIVIFASGLTQSGLSLKKVNTSLQIADSKVDSVNKKAMQSIETQEKEIKDLKSFVKDNFGEIVTIVKQLTSEDKDFKLTIQEAIKEIKTEQSQISAVYKDIENIKKAVKIAFCNDKQFYIDGRAQAIKKLLDEESGE